MASQIDPGRVGLAQHRRRPHDLGDTTGLRIGLYPATRPVRWLVRLGFALPFILLAWFTTDSLPDAMTVNDAAAAHVDAFDWNRADAAWVRDMYPPLGTVLVALIPGGQVGLAVAGALTAGVLLQQLLQVMYQRHFHWWKIVVLLLAMAANPLFAYTALTNFQAILSIALFGIATMKMASFINRRNTQAGFEAGILFMLAALTDTPGLVLVVVAGVTAPMLVMARQGQVGARWSNVLVVLFPTIAAFAGVMLLELAFLHDPVAAFRSAFDYDANKWQLVPHLFTTLDGFLLLCPVLAGIVLAFLSRRPSSSLIAVLIFCSIICGYVVGLVPENSAGNVFLVMTLLGIAVIPAAPTFTTSVLVAGVGMAQIAIAWTAAFQRSTTREWMEVVTQSLGGS